MRETEMTIQTRETTFGRAANVLKCAHYLKLKLPK